MNRRMLHVRRESSRGRRLPVSAGFLLLLALPAGSPAEAPPAALTSLTLEELLAVEVVSGVSRYEQPQGKAPAAVTVISAEEITRHGYRTLADLLAGVRGLYVTYDRNYHYLGVRGNGRPGDLNTRLLLLVDGERINDNIYDTAPIGTDFPLDLPLIERVEVIRGPCSSVYGANAFFGVINVVTREPAGRHETAVACEMGSSGETRVFGRTGGSLGEGTGFALAWSDFRSDGARLYYPEYSASSAGGYTEHTDADEARRIHGSLHGGGWRMDFASLEREKRVPTGSYDTVFDDPRNRTVDAHTWVTLATDQPVSERGSASLRASLHRYAWDGWYVYEDGVLKDEARGDWVTAEGRLRLDHALETRTVLGGEARGHLRQLQQHGMEGEALMVNRTARSAVWGLYAQHDRALREGLYASAGVRHDRYEAFGGTTNARAALIAQPASRLNVKLLFGQAFRAPNAYERDYTDDWMTQKPNPALVPERIETYELAVDGAVGAGCVATASVYRYNTRDLIAARTDPADGLIVFGNVEHSHSEGFELELARTAERGLRGRLYYGRQRAWDGGSGARLANSPQHMAGLIADCRLGAPWLTAGWETRYVGERGNLDGSVTGHYLLTNLQLRAVGAGGHTHVALGVYNLFDTAYGHPGYEEHAQRTIRQDGRTWRAQIGGGF